MNKAFEATIKGHASARDLVSRGIGKGCLLCTRGRPNVGFGRNSTPNMLAKLLPNELIRGQS